MPDKYQANPVLWWSNNHDYLQQVKKALSLNVIQIKVASLW
ncbi:hypothetical protein SEHO0A_01458 [Salmonella enterica subsp. houtenae str. ATCC BAA-1581]|nr:hypothetical protein SEHO0A_01458 [Salmonella enterica subsp. houtenae str. ATCC BAA-1581]